MKLLETLLSLRTALFFLILPVAASAQESEVLFTFNGPKAHIHFSTVITAGDINGDGTPDFIASMPSANIGGVNKSGAVYVLSGTDRSIIYEYHGSEFDYLGSAASLGDLNSDGFEDFAMGSTQTRGFGNGYVNVISGVDGRNLYGLFGSLRGSQFNASSFGTVKGVGDLDGDSIPDFLVAAKDTDVNGIQRAGSVFLFSGASSNLIYRIDGTVPFQLLGLSLAKLEDLNGDGYPEFSISSHIPPGNPLAVGACVIHSGIDGSELYSYQGQVAYERFAVSVASMPDFDLDGVADFALSDTGASPNGVVNAGSALFYSGATGALLFQLETWMAMES